MNRTLAAKDFQSVLRLTRGVSYGDDRLWTIFKLEQGSSSVLDLAIEKEIADERLHLFDLAEQIDQYLDSMTTKVEHRTAAGQPSFQQPVPRMGRRRVEPFKRVHLGENWFADLSRRQDCADAINHRIKMAVVSDAEAYCIL